MTAETTGTVIGGQLQLDQPLALPEGSRVIVTVRTATDIPPDWRERFTAGLARMRKLIEESPIGSGGVRFTREELYDRHLRGRSHE